jgi:hypothetical protein
MEEKLLNRIISVAYNDASLLEKVRIYKLAEKNKKVKAVLTEYKKAAKITHSFDLDYCPDEIIDSVTSGSNINQPKEKSLFFDLYSFIFRQPAVSAAILSVIILALVSTFVFQRPEIHNQYTKGEIETADKQVKHSLALIAGVFKKTTTTVEKDVLTERVSKPIWESLILVNDYLQGENRNENPN